MVTDDLVNLDALIAGLTGTAPKASFGTVYTSVDANKQINLANFSLGNTLSFELPHATTSRGGNLTLTGNTITYTPPAAATGTDYFVYVTKDTDGNIRSEVVTVVIN